jgi:hypothetical protein
MTNDDFAQGRFDFAANSFVARLAGWCVTSVYERCRLRYVVLMKITDKKVFCGKMNC